MKSIIAILVISTVTALAQTNTAPATIPQRSPEQIAAAAAETQRQLELMRAEMARSIEAAQARARLREAMIATGAVPQFDTNKIDRVFTNTPPFYNRTNMSPGIGRQIRSLEKMIPGISTNFTPEQLALTNAPVFTNRPPQ